MNKYTDIELQLMKDALKKEMPVLAIYIPEISKAAIGFYDEFKNSEKVANEDVVKFASKMTADFFGISGR
ncbi:hypothetical protein MOE86_15570 [Bacillus atrophaeus]|uniref:hypothetical protein n=1 Tax=Bacillus atrophaeus TaxID=1452 RepID=UPI002280A788|nr:hypothetical protein [Bacillus atrophaeus]MCY9198097.1 hypothetical protein [Bacillus atrophaeus]